MSYITDSYKAREWLNEQSYEWTPPEDESVTNHHLYSLPQRWKTKVQKNKERAFADWKIILHIQDSKRKDGYKR